MKNVCIACRHEWYEDGAIECSLCQSDDIEEISKKCDEGKCRL